MKFNRLEPPYNVLIRLSVILNKYIIIMYEY